MASAISTRKKERASSVCSSRLLWSLHASPPAIPKIVFTPVQKRWKAHLGTDYAAPTGTPILATAGGTVIAATYTSANGNYVKIKHTGTYTTQYLHMSRIGKGIRNGVHVEQGQVIGYVGSTGLATGPHVCYRFWKNGKQVDPLREPMQRTEPLPAKLWASFEAQMAPLKAQIDSLAALQAD